MPPKKMEAKVPALEKEVVGLKTTMQSMQLKAKENHERLIALLSKTSMEDGSAMKTSSQFPKGVLEEFRQLVKNVELPMFSIEDPAGWIVRAEVCFQVQESCPHVKVSLAQLCMDRSTIHFFKSLLDEHSMLTWE